MYQGKRSRNRRNRWNKPVLILVSLVMIVTMALGATLAYIFTGTGDVENTFTPSKVTTLVEETLEDGVKTDVKIKNTGDTDAFIRAAIVFTWQDAEGNVYGTAPTAANYEMTIGSGWTRGNDGFYYWKGSVAPKASTGELIVKCEYVEGAPEGYSLAVEILGSGIQSKGQDSNGKTPVELAWGEAAAKAVGAIN